MTLLVKALLDHFSRLDILKADLAFSGGMDSLLLALIARKFFPVHCIVVGLPASEDIMRAREAACTFDLDLEVFDIDYLRYRSHLIRVGKLLPRPSPMLMNLTASVSCIMSQCESETLIMGNGADEVFLGYHKYLDLSEEEFLEKRDKDLKRLLNEDLPRYEKIGQMEGIELHNPFLDRKIMDCSDLRPGKKEIVEALKSLSVGKKFIPRKKAMQFGNGTAKLFRGMAKMAKTDEKSLVLHYMEDKG